MPYHWEGDIIIQNTVIPGKRFVMGTPNKPIKADIREWISFEDNNIMKEILGKLGANKGLPIFKNPGDFDERAKIIWDFVAQHLRYVHDSAKQKKEDFWLFPPEIYTLRHGDCEDGSFLLASLLIASGISPFCVRVVLGEVFDEKGISLGGHCWPVYKNEIGEWCILESTLDAIPARLPEADQFTKPKQFFRYVPYYCFNNYHLWQVLPEKDRGSRARNIEKYLRLRRNKVHMKKTRLPSGGWLSHITGDWEPGHLEITEEILKKQGFSNEAVDIAGDASQDPDFYDWKTPSAHAQTNNDQEGRTNESIGQAQEKYLGWIGTLTEKMVKETPSNDRFGLYLLGYILHGIQDLATHKGITNAQHAYVSKMLGKENDPDHIEENRQKAKEFSARYLENLKEKYLPTFERLVAYQGRERWLRERLWPSEKMELLAKDGWDLSVESYLEYAALNEKYNKIKNEYPVNKTLWDVDKVLKGVLQNVG